MGQRIIGLTGGIATGKSTVAQYLATQHGLPVLDADVYARQAVAPGSAILAAIAQRYGAASSRARVSHFGGDRPALWVSYSAIRRHPQPDPIGADHL